MPYTSCTTKYDRKNSRGHSQGLRKIFRAPIYRVHCTVMFAIAQLSCYYIQTHFEATKGKLSIINKFITMITEN